MLVPGNVDAQAFQMGGALPVLMPTTTLWLGTTSTQLAFADATRGGLPVYGLPCARRAAATLPMNGYASKRTSSTRATTAYLDGTGTAFATLAEEWDKSTNP